MNRIVGVVALFVSVALLLTCTSQAGAQPVSSASLKKTSSSLYFLDSKTGWVLANGKLYATVDAGASWTRVNRNILADCERAVFANQKVGWILRDRWTTPSRSNSVLATQDGGHTWQQILRVPSPIFSLDLLGKDLGYVSSRWQPLHKTVDGGKAWTELDGIEGLNYVYFLDEKRGWGYGGAIWQTGDGGQTWKKTVDYDQVTDLWNASFVDATTGWIAGGAELWRTTDGETWRPVQVEKRQGAFVDIDFVSRREGWIATADGLILHSGDGGETWTVHGRLFTKPAAIRFVTNLNGWALSQDGKLSRSDDGGRTWKAVPLR
jgi:photosystem II stability/assembly factor-like uncharacterized protein